MLGILLFQYFCNIIGNREYWILLAISMATLFYFEGAVLTFLSVATLLMIAFVKKVPPFLQFLGTISFSLYLVHIPIGGRLNNLAGIFIENVNLRELMVFAAFGCCLLAAFIFYVLVEKKFKNLAASIAYKK
jgi:peptidoglycan/LPS O-acetylase OafA/YrhL